MHFFYCPDLSTADEIRHEAAAGYDAVIAAATVIPEDAAFPRGGVRIGAGTGNMRSASWGGGNGVGGTGVLMNTPGVNSRATAQMVFKALLRRRPDLPLEHLHALTVAGAFDTGRNLREYPTRKLESYRLAVIGFGNIGRKLRISVARSAWMWSCMRDKGTASRSSGRAGIRSDDRRCGAEGGYPECPCRPRAPGRSDGPLRQRRPYRPHGPRRPGPRRLPDQFRSLRNRRNRCVVRGSELGAGRRRSG